MLVENGIAETHALRVLRYKLHKWTEKYHLESRTKIFKHTLRVTFDLDDSYTLFVLTWVRDPQYPNWTNYRLVTDLNNKI